MTSRPPDEPLPVPRAHVVLGAALGGALLGLLILLADLPWWGPEDREVTRSGPFGLWAGAIALQAMAWVLALPAIRRIARRWRTPASARSLEVRAATGALVAVALLVALLPSQVQELPETIPGRSVKTAVLNLLAFGVAIAAARAMWFAVAWLREPPTGDSAHDVRRHARLRGDLEILLAILGALVSLAVLASAALRALTIHVDPERALPPQAVLTYGIVLSALLALIYVPAHLTMLRAGRRLQDELAPLPPVTDQDFGERLERRDRLGGLLGLDVSASVAFRAGVAILSPLLGSLTTLLPDLG